MPFTIYFFSNYCHSKVGLMLDICRTFAAPLCWSQQHLNRATFISVTNIHSCPHSFLYIFFTSVLYFDPLKKSQITAVKENKQHMQTFNKILFASILSMMMSFTQLLFANPTKPILRHKVWTCPLHLTLYFTPRSQFYSWPINNVSVVILRKLPEISKA